VGVLEHITSNCVRILDIECEISIHWLTFARAPAFRQLAARMLLDLPLLTVDAAIELLSGDER
jgi:hypothetical protein